MGNKVNSHLEDLVPIRSEMMLNNLRRWNEFEMVQSNQEVGEEVKSDAILGENLSREFKKVEEWLTENNLSQYVQNFVSSKVIFDDLFDIEVMLGEEGMRKELISDAIPLQRFRLALKKLKEERNPVASFTQPTKKEGDGEDENSEKTTKKEKKKEKDPIEEKLWYLDKKFIFIGDTIAKGSFGVVKRGILRMGLFKVAIAVKESFMADENVKKEVTNEVEIMSQLNHTNVCKCFGCYFEGRSAYIVLELCSKGDLYGYLQANQDIPLEMRIDFMMQIAGGMAHLHGKNIMHGDMKSKNILLKGNAPKFRLKICDFGTSKETVTFDNDFQGTAEYMAPEYMNLEELERKAREKKNKKLGDQTHDTLVKKLDVYAFGILMWEIYTGKIPLFKERQECTSDYELFRRIHKNKLRPSMEDMKDCPSDLRDLYDACVDESPEQRPESFELICYELGEILAQYKETKNEKKDN